GWPRNPSGGSGSSRWQPASTGAICRRRCSAFLAWKPTRANSKASPARCWKCVSGWTRRWRRTRWTTANGASLWQRSAWSNLEQMRLRVWCLATGALAVSSAFAQPKFTAADYQRAEKFMTYNTAPLVLRSGVRPNWLADDRFWYRVTTADG